MADFKPPPKPERNDNEPSKVKIVEQIVEGKCKVCKDAKNRNRIDYLLAMRTPYKELERLYPHIPERSFANHDRKHLRYEDEAIKRVIEHEAGLSSENLETGVKGAFLRRTTLDAFIKKFFDAMIAGEVIPEAKDVVKMIELRERLDAESSTATIEQYELQFNAFKEAVEEICSANEMNEILSLVRSKLGMNPALEPAEQLEE